MRKKCALLLAFSVVASASAQTAIPAFHSSGDISNTKPAGLSQPVDLIWKYSGKQIVVGKLTPDGHIEVNVTAELLADVQSGTLLEFKTNPNRGCDPSKLEISDTSVYTLYRFYYKVGSDEYYTYPAINRKNMDGSTSRTSKLFVWATGPGSIKGRINCNSDFYDYNYSLSQGWNLINKDDTYSPSTQSWGNTSYSSGGQVNTYAGKWLTFKAN